MKPSDITGVTEGVHRWTRGEPRPLVALSFACPNNPGMGYTVPPAEVRYRVVVSRVLIRDLVSGKGDPNAWELRATWPCSCEDTEHEGILVKW